MCLFVSLIGAAVTLLVAAQRLGVGTPASNVNASVNLTAQSGDVALCAAVLVAVGGVLVFAVRSPLCGSLILWLGGLLLTMVFVGGPAFEPLAGNPWVASMICSVLAAFCALGCVHRELAHAPRPAFHREVQPPPTEFAVGAGLLAWIGAALLGINALSTGGDEFLSNAFVVGAVLASGTSAIAAGLILPSTALLTRNTLLGAKLIVVVALLAVFSDALLQFVAWLPSSAEARTACCVGRQVDWRGFLVVLPVIAAALCAVGILRLWRSTGANPRTLLIRWLWWPLAITIAASLYEIAHDLTLSADFSGLYSVAVVGAVAPSIVLSTGIVLRNVVRSHSTSSRSSRSVTPH